MILIKKLIKIIMKMKINEGGLKNMKKLERYKS